MAQWRDNISAGLRTLELARGLGRLKRAPDEAARIRARAHLADLMGREQGLAAKIGQFLAEGDSGSAFEDCRENLAGLETEDFLGELSAAWGCDARDIVCQLGDEVYAASIGQVRRAELFDGRVVALKLRHPGIDKALNAELRILGLLPRVGPAKRWGLDLEGMKRVLSTRLRSELDYISEARNQSLYRDEVSWEDRIVVPEVHHDLCRENLLVQDWEQGLDLKSAAQQWGPRVRRDLGRVLLRHFFLRFFKKGLLHADPHPGNLRARLRKDASAEILLYDFGALAPYPVEQALAFLRLILAARERNADSPGASLVAAGFDARKLQQLSTSITELARILVEPFTCNYPFDARSWRLGERLRKLLSEECWWFRSAGPPEFLNVMRAMDGLVRQLITLDARLDWFQILEEAVPELLVAARGMELPAFTTASNFAGQAQKLRVRVQRNGVLMVSVTMPIRVLEDLQSVMDEELWDKLVARGIHPQDMANAARRAGLKPGQLFSADDDGQQISLELE